MSDLITGEGRLKQTPGQMVALLRGHRLRCRTAILLVSPSQIAEALNIAARLGLDAVDYHEVLVRSLPPGAKFVPLTAASEETRLDTIAEQPVGADAVLVYNFDLAVAKLEHRQRALLWSTLRDRLPHRRRALVLAMPLGAERLLPADGELVGWQEGRLAAWGD